MEEYDISQDDFIESIDERIYEMIAMSDMISFRKRIIKANE